MADDGDLIRLFRNISDKLGNLGLNEILTVFKGDSPTEFKAWCKQIDKAALLHDISEEKKKFLAYKFSHGAVSEFIHRNLTQTPDTTWPELLRELTNRFGEVSDSHLKFTQLSNICQRPHEMVQNYAERIIQLAQEAYANYDQHLPLIENQLTGIFLKGLSDEAIKVRLLRERPATFQEAVRIATREQDLKIRCKLHASEHLRTFHSHAQSHEQNQSHRMNNHSMTQTQTPFALHINKPMVDCNESMDVNFVRRKRMFCDYCKSNNHNTSDCRRKRDNYVNEIRQPQGYSRPSHYNHNYNAYQPSQGFKRQDNFPIHNRNPHDHTRNQRNPRANVQCFFCKQYGHFKSDCERYIRFLNRHSDNSGNGTFSKNS